MPCTSQNPFDRSNTTRINLLEVQIIKRTFLNKNQDFKWLIEWKIQYLTLFSLTDSSFFSEKNIKNPNKNRFISCFIKSELVVVSVKPSWEMLFSIKSTLQNIGVSDFYLSSIFLFADLGGLHPSNKATDWAERGWGRSSWWRTAATQGALPNFPPLRWNHMLAVCQCKMAAQMTL